MPSLNHGLTTQSSGQEDWSYVSVLFLTLQFKKPLPKEHGLPQIPIFCLSFWIRTLKCHYFSRVYVWEKSIINEPFSHERKKINHPYLKKQNILLQLLSNTFFSVNSLRIQEEKKTWSQNSIHLEREDHHGGVFEWGLKVLFFELSQRYCRRGLLLTEREKGSKSQNSRDPVCKPRARTETHAHTELLPRGTEGGYPWEGSAQVTDQSDPSTTRCHVQHLRTHTHTVDFSPSSVTAVLSQWLTLQLCRVYLDTEQPELNWLT